MKEEKLNPEEILDEIDLARAEIKNILNKYNVWITAQEACNNIFIFITRIERTGETGLIHIEKEFY